MRRSNILQESFQENSVVRYVIPIRRTIFGCFFCVRTFRIVDTHFYVCSNVYGIFRTRYGHISLELYVFLMMTFHTCHISRNCIVFRDLDFPFLPFFCELHLKQLPQQELEQLVLDLKQQLGLELEQQFGQLLERQQWLEHQGLLLYQYEQLQCCRFVIRTGLLHHL